MFKKLKPNSKEQVTGYMDTAESELRTIESRLVDAQAEGVMSPSGLREIADDMMSVVGIVAEALPRLNTPNDISLAAEQLGTASMIAGNFMGLASMAQGLANHAEMAQYGQFNEQSIAEFLESVLALRAMF